NETRNGNGRQKLFSDVRPVATSPLPVVTENGTPLVVAFGYSPGADVTFEPASGTFYRLTGPAMLMTRWPGVAGRWAQGIQNVGLTYTGGYVPAAMPEDLKLLAKYITAVFWKSMDRKEIGVARRSID